MKIPNKLGEKSIGSLASEIFTEVFKEESCLSDEMKGFLKNPVKVYNFLLNLLR